jgi:nitrate/nitrite transport system permease protein
MPANEKFREKVMGAVMINGDFGVKKPVDRSTPEMSPATSSQRLATVVAEPVKEKKMETAAVSGEISGTPLSERISTLARALLPPVLGMLILLGIWYIATFKGGSIPGPGKTWDAAAILFSDPFYRNGPNDQGIGWNVLSSLQRVGIGFGFAALVGIPLGFILGRSQFLSAMINPIISLLRPVSPLAWLPIGLLVFQKADPAATYTIFICSIWPNDHEHRPGRAACAAGLPERGAGAQSVGMESCYQNPFPGRAALHADRYSPLHRHRLAGDCGR